MSSNVSLPVPSPTIPVAGFKDVYNVAAVEKALQDLPQSANEALRSLYEKMLRVGGQRFAVKPSGLPEMQPLFDELPNFGEVLEHIRRQLALCVDSNDDVELQPILLLGGPGIGKTHFARRVSQMLGTGYGFVPMSSLTAGWVLSGASSQWKNAKPGKVFETFLNGDYANPVMVVDEIDKASADGQYDPLGALYELLETQTAARFTDEFAEIPIDASSAVWFATANEASRIPEPLLNRMHVYEIDPPDAAGSARIARSLYREIRESHDWGRHFPETPSGSVVEKLALLTPREMRRAVQTAFGNAKVSGRDELRPEDVDIQRGGRKSRIGF
jgi:ATP-dependent Lon protease